MPSAIKSPHLDNPKKEHDVEFFGSPVDLEYTSLRK